MRTQEVAERLGVEPRTYERFEAGDVQVDTERLLQFAEATDSDPIALFAAIAFENPALAVACMDAKLASIQTVALEHLALKAGPGLRRLDAATAIAVVEAAYEELAKDLLARGAFARSWIDRLRSRRG